MIQSHYTSLLHYRPLYISNWSQPSLTNLLPQSIPTSTKSPNLPPLPQTNFLPQFQIMFQSQASVFYKTYTFWVVNKRVCLIIAHSYIHKIIKLFPSFLLLTTLCSLKRAKKRGKNCLEIFSVKTYIHFVHLYEYLQVSPRVFYILGQEPWPFHSSQQWAVEDWY